MKAGVSWPEMSWLGAEGTLRGQGSWCSPLRSLAHDTQAGPRAPCPPTPTDPSAKMPACAPHPAIHHCSPIPCHFLWTSQLPALCWMGWWGSEPSSESGVLARPLASHPPSIGASCHARLTGLLPIRPTLLPPARRSGAGEQAQGSAGDSGGNSHIFQPRILAGGAGGPGLSAPWSAFPGKPAAVARPPRHTWDQPSQNSTQGPGLALGHFRTLPRMTLGRRAHGRGLLRAAEGRMAGALPRSRMQSITTPSGPSTPLPPTPHSQSTA